VERRKEWTGMNESERQTIPVGPGSIHGQQLRLDDAGELPTGAWIGEEDGRIYRAITGHSLVAVQSKALQNFKLLSTNPYESDEALRLRAARVGITPQF
jgi:hypothetical protein